MFDVNLNIVCLFVGQRVVRGEVDIQHHGHYHKQRITKLFVFGDSYADTGNVDPRGFAPSWKQPYGVTFPGKPAGRFSDGRVLTDYIGISNAFFLLFLLGYLIYIFYKLVTSLKFFLAILYFFTIK